MESRDRTREETEPLILRLPVKLLDKVDEIKEKGLYKNRQAVILEAIREKIKMEEEATA
jgi:metal-responsive CopG/Arc/MetJ family transcriptional regulator